MPSPTGIVKKAMGGTSQAAHALAALQDAESCANLVAKCNDVLATIEQKKSWNHRTRRRYETALHSLVARLVPPELLSCLSCWKPDTSARTSPQCKVVTMDNYISTLPRTVRMRKDSDDLRRWFCWWVVRWAYVEHANHAVKRISRPSVQQTKKMACFIWAIVQHMQKAAGEGVCSTGCVDRCLSDTPFVGHWLNHCSIDDVLRAMAAAVGDHGSLSQRRTHLWWLTVVFTFTTRILQQRPDKTSGTFTRMAPQPEVWPTIKQLTVLSVAELGAIEAVSKPPMMAAIWALSAGAALRVGDVVCIRLQDIYNPANGVHSVGLTRAKCNTPKPFVMFPDAIAQTTRWIQDHRRPRESSWLFPAISQTGCDRHVSTQYVQRAMQRIFVAAGIVRHGNKPPSFHIIRHTVSQRLADAGNSPEMVSRFLGHSSTRTTVTHYLNRDYSAMVQKMQIPWSGQQNEKTGNSRNRLLQMVNAAISIQSQKK